jgi:hypothetical protein
MSAVKPDQYDGQGGSYILEPDGTRRLVDRTDMPAEESPASKTPAATPPNKPRPN